MRPTPELNQKCLSISGVGIPNSQNIGTPPKTSKPRYDQSSLGVWGGHSQNVGTPPQTPTPRYNQSPKGFLGWAFSNSRHSNPDTDTQVQSELLRGVWGGHSQTVGTPPQTPTPRYNQSSLGVSGVGIPNCWHSTPYTDTQVQSELLRGLWGGHSQTAGIPPQTPSPLHNDIS